MKITLKTLEEVLEISPRVFTNEIQKSNWRKLEGKTFKVVTYTSKYGFEISAPILGKGCFYSVKEKFCSYSSEKEEAKK